MSKIKQNNELVKLRIDYIEYKYRNRRVIGRPPAVCEGDVYEVEKSKCSNYYHQEYPKFFSEGPRFFLTNLDRGWEFYVSKS